MPDRQVVCGRQREKLRNYGQFLAWPLFTAVKTQGSADHSVRTAQSVKVLLFNRIKHTQHFLYALGVPKKVDQNQKVVNNKTANVRITYTLRRVRATVVVVEKQ